MRYCALLSGEHETLPRAELLSVIAADGDYEVEDSLGRLLIVEADGLDASRLAMTHETGEVLARTGIDAIEELREAVPSFEGTFAVRVRNAGDRNLDLEREIGSIIQEASGRDVDLDEPDVRFRVHVHDGEAVLYRVLEDIDTGAFEGRRSHLRPFSSPVSLHPKLARAMVNLAGLRRGDAVLDPMCGTGGILIEAGLVGMEVHGRDIEDEMVEGSRENLAAFDVEGAIEQGAIGELAGTFDADVDAVVSDLPYGRASPKEGEGLVETFLEQARKVCDGPIVVMTDREEIDGREPDFSIYVHKSLSRHMYVLPQGAEPLKPLDGTGGTGP
jgi:tRNA (guanine10-N2)-dimethyltransferase